MCWGRNSNGQLGDGTNNDTNEPVAVKSLIDVVAISAGQQHTCALTRDDAVHCWGFNEWGQLGDGSTLDRSEP
jgi:alpha-tubulin suppressor-like RCC1 family protein